MDSLKWKKNWGNNVENKLLDHKYKIIFKSKKHLEKLIDSWDMKILKKLREKNWENLFSF
jgi:hypothetical protein